MSITSALLICFPEVIKGIAIHHVFLITDDEPLLILIYL